MTEEHTTNHTRAAFELEMPPAADIDQTEEWCWIRFADGVRRRLRFHEYRDIYTVPRLYECLFCERLQCQSPERVVGMLARVLAHQDGSSGPLSVLDVGAGNGMVGEELRRLGAGHIVGIDIIPEAAEAARRDRPGVYDDYLVADLTDLKPDELARLRGARFNAMTTVAALGLGHIPPEAFAAAFNLVATPGWVAFNIKDALLEGDEESGFSMLIERMVDDGLLEVGGQEKYRHRLSLSGAPYHYYAVAGRKTGDIPAEWLAEIAEQAPVED